MRKLLLVLPVVLLFAVGCNSTSQPTSSEPTNQQGVPTTQSANTPQKSSGAPLDKKTLRSNGNNTGALSVKRPVVTQQTVQPSPVSAPAAISLKTAEVSYDTYFTTEATIQGVVFDLIPAGQFTSGNEIMLEDEQDHSYMAVIFNVDSARYQNINLGDEIQIKGVLRGGGGPKDRWIQQDANPAVVGHTTSIPTPATVLSDAQSLVTAHQADIQAAMQNVDSSTSFNQCAQINDTLISDLCVAIGGSCAYNGTQLPTVYKDSTTLINNAVIQVVNACMQKWYSRN